MVLCSVTLVTSDHYLPLEWVHPLERALQLLGSLEAQLIAGLSPKLNIQATKTYAVREPISLHLEDHLETGVFGSGGDDFLFPPS